MFHTYGAQVGVVGRGWNGQHKRILSGMDGLLLLVVVGEGRVIVPVDCAMRRPDPVGFGAPCRDTRRWARLRLDERLAALCRRGVVWPAPMGGAERWLSDSKRMPHGHEAHQGTVLVEGKQSSVFPWADGHQVQGHDLTHGEGWRWQQHPWEAGVRYARLRATSPTYGQVTVVIVAEPGQDRFSLRCLETARRAPQCSRRWRRRSWIALVGRTLQHLLATASCQGHSEDASYGHLV